MPATKQRSVPSSSASKLLKYPTYGELIDLYTHHMEREHLGDAALFCSAFNERYPNVTIGRPTRFLETVKRLTGPTRSSLRGGPKYTGSSLAMYRKKVWEPRLRSPSVSACTALFPIVLSSNGLTEELLRSTIHNVETKANENHVWQVKGVPSVGFYRALHSYLQKKSLTKVAIARIYLAIDPNLRKEKNIHRPDNVFRFIERVVKDHKLPSDKPMIYSRRMDQNNVQQKQIQAITSQLEQCNGHIDELNTECVDLRQQLIISRDELQSSHRALREITNNNMLLKNQSNKTNQKFEKLRLQHATLEEEHYHVQIENLDMIVDDDVQSNESIYPDHGDSTVFNIKCKDGTRYTPEIRKLYYTLLAQQVPASKISDIIKSVVKCMCPAVDVEQLKLPKKSCASYMRREELKTISDAHKATVFCEQSMNGKELLLNTDGTTKRQKKLGGTVVNDMTLSVNELLDGTAVSAISDISNEFEKLVRVT